MSDKSLLEVFNEMTLLDASDAARPNSTGA